MYAFCSHSEPITLRRVTHFIIFSVLLRGRLAFVHIKYNLSVSVDHLIKVFISFPVTVQVGPRSVQICAMCMCHYGSQEYG